MSGSYNRTYWVAQSLGWLLFAFISMFASYVENSLSVRSAAVVLLAVLTGLVLTHLIRGWMVRFSKGMHIIPQARKWLFVLIPLVATIQAFLQYAWQYLFYTNFTLQTIEVSQVFYAAVNWLVIFSVWTSLYMLYRYMETSRQTEISEL
ncbi:MAG: hypothetical protein ACHQF2_08355, partial [Flavobacteriales bacterium]